MASISAEDGGEDSLGPASNTSLQSPPFTVPTAVQQPTAYSGVQMHVYPFPPGIIPAQPIRTKRRQVKNACTNCQKSCKKCDDARPCRRCVRYGFPAECVDSQRKERKKGGKRGPYKKRDGKGHAGPSAELAGLPQQNPALSNPPLSGGSMVLGPYVHFATPPGYFGQYPPPNIIQPGQQGEGSSSGYTQYYFAPLPAPTHSQPSQGGQGGEGYASPQLIYPAYVAQLPPMSYPQYVMPNPDSGP